MKMESIFVVAALLFYSCGLLSNPSIEPPTRHKTSDKAGVNVASGRSSFSLDTISIGAGDLSLQHKMMSNNDNFYVAFDNFWGYMYRTESSSVGSKLEFNFGNQVETISYPANFLSPDFVEHSSSAPKRKLKKLNATTYEFTTSAGTVYEYSTVMAPAAPFHTLADGHHFIATLTKVTYPNGFQVNIHYKTSKVFFPLSSVSSSRIQAVTTNTGLMLKYTYKSDSAVKDNWNWFLVKEIKTINNSVDYCNPMSDACTTTSSWPTVSFNWPGHLLAFGAGDLTVQLPDQSRVIYKHKMYCNSGPGVSDCNNGATMNNDIKISDVVSATSSGTSTESYSRGNQWACSSFDCSTLKTGLITKVTKGNSVWSYTYSPPPADKYIPTAITSKGPLEQRLTVTMNTLLSNIKDISDNEQGATFYFASNYENQVERIHYWYGNSIHFQRDAAGNITEKREKPAANHTDAELVTTANYQNNCSPAFVTQHKPASITDPKNQTTSFTYHCESGLVKSITSPPDKNSKASSKYYSYEQHYAYYKKDENSIVQSSSPVWLLTSERECLTGTGDETSCTDATEAIVKTYHYGVTNAANNLWLKGVSVSYGSETRTTCYTYDNIGNKVAEYQPMANKTSCD